MEHKILINKLNGHDTSGKIGKINFSTGDTVKVGDVLFSIESGKGSLQFKSEFNGVIKTLNINCGDEVVKGQEIGTLHGDKNQTIKKKAYNFGIKTPNKKEIKAEVLIIGGGPGGYVAAIRSAQLGKKVVLIEEDKLGGTCLNYGCIPTKALAHSTKVLNHIKHGADYGFEVSDYNINISKIIGRKQDVVETLVGGIEHLMEINDIEVIRGTAKVNDENTIIVKNKDLDATISFENLIIATGSEPCCIPIDGHDLPSIMTSKDALSIEKIPTSITIIGGGVIGMEFAFIFNALGSEVHVVEFAPDILYFLDQDVIDVIRTSAEEKGIKIHSGACASCIHESMNKQMITAFMIEEQVNYISSEKIMMAVGRKARLDSIDLTKLGVDLNEKENGIEVNDHMQTSRDNIYAIGDVTNIMQLAHVASHQGIVAAEVISGLNSTMHYDTVPSAIFTSPEIGHVGMTEREARKEDRDIKISKFPFQANGKALAMGETKGFVKLIYDNEKDCVIGATIVGSSATDMIATLTNLINQKVTKEEAINVIYAHPTAAESIHEAILGLDDRGLHNV